MSSVRAAVILSGDIVYFQISFEHRYVADSNWGKRASLQSMDKMAAIIAKNMRSFGLTTISLKATDRKSCRRIMSDDYLAVALRFR